MHKWGNFGLYWCGWKTVGSVPIENRFTVSQTGDTGVLWCRFQDQNENSGYCAQIGSHLENPAVELGLVSRVELNDKGRRRPVLNACVLSEKTLRQDNKVTAIHTEARSPLAGNFQLKVAPGKVLQRFNQKPRPALATGLAVLLCLAWAGCTGFFINPSLSSIFITPASTTIAVNGTQQLTATGTYSCPASAGNGESVRPLR